MVPLPLLATSALFSQLPELQIIHFVWGNREPNRDIVNR